MTTFLWERPETHSIEYLRVSEHSIGYTMRGKILLLLEGVPTDVEYEIGCDSEWRVYQAHARYHQDERTRTAHFRVEKDQRWYVDGGISNIIGLYDFDLEISPATNTIAINRLKLAVGESGESEAVWVQFPSLTPEILSQRYTRLETHLYRYEAPALDFETLIEVDDHGWVTNYRGLWTRVPSP